MASEISRAKASEATISGIVTALATTGRTNHQDLSGRLISEINRASNAEKLLRETSIYSNLIPCNSSVFADNLAPMITPSNYAKFDGWYVKNPFGTNSDGNNIVNWYLSGNGLTYADIEYIAYGYYPIVASGKPSLVIYTKDPAGSNIGSVSFPYTSKRVFTPTNSPTLQNPTYMYGSVNGSTTLTTPKIPGFTSIQMSINNTESTGATPNSTDEVVAIAFNYTASTVGEVEVILREVNIITPTVTISNKFTNDSVINFYTALKVSALYAYHYGISGDYAIPPTTNHSGFSTNNTTLNLAKANYGSTNGNVLATYEAKQVVTP